MSPMKSLNPNHQHHHTSIHLTLHTQNQLNLQVSKSSTNFNDPEPSSRSRTCPECAKIFKHHNSLSRHKTAHHNKPERKALIQCNDCDTRYTYIAYKINITCLVVTFMFNRFTSLKQLIGHRKAIHKIKHLITLKTLKHSFNGKKFKKGRPM